MTKDPFPMRSDEARRLQASVNDNNNNNNNNNNNSDNGNEWNVMDTTTATYTRGSRNTGSNVSGGEAGLLGTNNNNNNNKKKKSSSGSDSDNMNIYENLDEDKAMSKSELYMESQDEYLDNPIDSIHGSGSGSNVPMIQSCSSKNSIVVRALKALHKKLYGDKMPVSQLLKTLCLSSTLFFMIGGYWLLRSLKDPVLTALCGVTAIPKAKMLSVVVVLAVVSIYNKLLDDPNITKHSLFYKFGMFYFLLFTTISLLLKHPTIGLPNQEPSYDRILGWVSYCSIESFGSVMVSLFWSFANSNFDLEDAKASYGLLVATAQIGSIIGPTIVNLYANTWGVANIYFIGALFMLMLQACMYIYVNVYGTTETNPNGTSKNRNNNSSSNSNKPAAKKKGKAGVLEGLHLFVKYNYVKGIFAISCLFMVEVTIVDYTMKVLAKDHFTKLHPCLQGQSCYTSNGMSADATAAFTTFMGLFGQATNTLSFLLSFFGTSAVIRYLGLRLALLLFPTLCWIVIIMVRINPTLYVVFAAMMILKANSYALNNPTKEMLYQPTSSAVKYKAKSWIDIFGARGSKALGSLVTNAFSDSSTSLVANGSLVGIAVASFLIWNARFMGRSFEKYVESGYIVGSEEEEEEEENNNSGISGGGHVSLAGKQNDTHDTSCAIYDEDEKEIVENVSDHSEEQNDDVDNDGDNDNKNTKPQVEMV